MAIEGRPDAMVRMLFSAGLGALLYREQVDSTAGARTLSVTLFASSVGTMLVVQVSERVHVRAGGTFWIAAGDTSPDRAALNFTAGLGHES